MIWKTTGNKWLDSWVVKAMNFHSELSSAAAMSSSLDKKDIEDLEKCMIKLNKINHRISKRLNKKKS